MKTSNVITRILWAAYLITMILFLLDALSPFEIKSQSIKSSVYLGFLISSPVFLL